MSKSKMLVGIITINDYANYGNRLQNYALNQLLGGNENVRPYIWTQNDQTF